MNHLLTSFLSLPLFLYFKKYYQFLQSTSLWNLPQDFHMLKVYLWYFKEHYIIAKDVSKHLYSFCIIVIFYEPQHTCILRALITHRSRSFVCGHVHCYHSIIVYLCDDCMPSYVCWISGSTNIKLGISQSTLVTASWRIYKYYIELRASEFYNTSLLQIKRSEIPSQHHELVTLGLLTPLLRPSCRTAVSVKQPFISLLLPHNRSLFLCFWKKILNQQKIAVSAHSYVSIVAPRAIRPNSEYHVAVTIHKASVPENITVEVFGQLDRGGNFTELKFIAVQPNSTGILNFTVGIINWFNNTYITIP